MSRLIAHPRQQYGVSMLEVLIALVLLVTSLLGATALQITGLHTNRSAYYRSQASIIAYDIADRIRLNASYAMADQDRYTFSTADKSTPVATDCITKLSGCDAAKMRDIDIRQWSEHFFDVTGVGHDGSAYQTLLPGGVGKVSVSGAEVSINISWQEIDWNVGGGSNKGDKTRQLNLDLTLSS